MVSWRQRVRVLKEQNDLLRELNETLQQRMVVQDELIARLQQEVEELKRRLKSYENPHTPSSKKRKKNTERDESKPRYPGKPRGGKGGGVELPPPDEVEEHTLDVCPVSGLPLGEPVGYRKRTVIDFPDRPIRVVEHRIMRYVSPVTGDIVEPSVDLGNSIYGKRLQSIVVMLKNLTNSHRKIAFFLRELGAPSFSAAQVQRIADRFIDQLGPKREAYLEALRRESFVHADETGFRKDGKKGWVWGVFTKTIAIFSAQMSRARKQIKKLLPSYGGVFVTDGYKAYDDCELRQRCWAHLLREVKDLAEKNDEIKTQYVRLNQLYAQLKALNTKPPDEAAIAKAKEELADIVTCLKAIKQGKKLATLIENGGDDWFTALYHEGVPLDNNLAERELRSVVLLRKTIGCYRNQKGKNWIDIVMSVIHTWQLQGLNVFQQLCMVAH